MQPPDDFEYTNAEIAILRNTKEVSIAQARSGLVKIVGKIGAERASASLGGGAQVVYSELRHYSVDRRSKYEELVLDRVEKITHHKFWVDDGTGRVLIEPDKMRLELEVGGSTDELAAEFRFRLGGEVAIVGDHPPS
jgi:hypothetical protein